MLQTTILCLLYAYHDAKTQCIYCCYCSLRVSLIMIHNTMTILRCLHGMMQKRRSYYVLFTTGATQREPGGSRPTPPDWASPRPTPPPSQPTRPHRPRASPPTFTSYSVHDLEPRTGIGTLKTDIQTPDTHNYYTDTQLLYRHPTTIQTPNY